MRTSRLVRFLCILAFAALIATIVPNTPGALAEDQSVLAGAATPPALGSENSPTITAPVLVTEAARDDVPSVADTTQDETQEATDITSDDAQWATPPAAAREGPVGDVGTPVSTDPLSVVTDGATPGAASARSVQGTPAEITAAFTEACTPGANKVLTGCVYNGEDLGNADFSGSILTGATFNGANLPGANFSGATLTGATFDGANLACADFSQANVTVATFDGANLLGADFSGAVLTSATFGESTTCPDGTMSGANGNSCLSNLVSDVCATPSPTASTTVDATVTTTVDTTVTSSPDDTTTPPVDETATTIPGTTGTVVPTESVVASATSSGPGGTATGIPSVLPTLSPVETVAGTLTPTLGSEGTVTVTEVVTVTALVTPTAHMTLTPTRDVMQTVVMTAESTQVESQTPAVNVMASPTDEATGTISSVNAVSTITVTPGAAAQAFPNTGDGQRDNPNIPSWWSVTIMACCAILAAGTGWTIRKRRR